MISRYEAKLNARARLGERHGSSAGAFVITSVISYVFVILIPLIGAIIGCPPSILGYTIYNLKLVKRKIPAAAESLEGFDNAIQAIYLGALRFLFLTLWCLTGLAIAAVGIICFSWSNALGIILLILGFGWTCFIFVYKLLQYSMSYWIMADNPKISAGEALDSSKALTSGHIADLFVLELSFIGWYLLTMIFYPMILYVSPYHYATYGYIFLQLTESTQLPPLVQKKPDAQVNHIECIAGNYQGYTFDLRPNEEIVLGRDPALSHIVLSDDNERLSRKHCGIVFDVNLGKYGVIDYSRHGTFLENGTRVSAGAYMWVDRGTLIYLVDKKTMFKLV